jgi:LacI family transcriptional regulator
MSNKKNITIYEVAKRAGVSQQTVSRVLNDHPDVSSDTRKHVKQIIEELNYRPNAIAQSLSRRKSKLLGVVTAGLRFIGPSRTLSGITSKTEALGYGLLIKELPQFQTNDVQTLLQWFQSHQVDGIIWAVPEIGDNHSWLDSFLPDLDIPLLFLTMPQRKDTAVVTIDNYYGAQLAVKHLIECGRQHIAHISGPLDWWEARQRMAGWTNTVKQAGMECLPQMSIEGNWSSRSGLIAIEQLLAQYPQMDAVFVANDQMALSVLLAANKAGKKIPDDLMVVGFDGIPESEYFLPPLTTILQNQDLLGRFAVTELVNFIDRSGSDDPVKFSPHHSLQPEIIIRESSRKVEMSKN